MSTELKNKGIKFTAVSGTDSAVKTQLERLSKPTGGEMPLLNLQVGANYDNLGSYSSNLTEADSRITDVDMAKATIELAKGSILEQSAQSIIKQCVTINIVDFKCTPLKKLYSSYHLTEDKTGYRLTDIIEVHFLEIPKLLDDDIEIHENDPVVQWMEFLDAKSKGKIEMLAEKNKDIKKAYDLLQVISNDKKARMLYEARQAEISDQLTRMKSAVEKGSTERAIEDATNFLKLGVSEDIVAKGTGLPIEQVIELKKKYQN